MRFFAFIVLLSALAIAGCSAFFSIIGLKLLFVGGGVSIIVMGIALEIGKLITATFLKQKWKEISIWMRTYMLLSTLVLVAITSVGIYGFLSSGYAATEAVVQGYERQIATNVLKINELEKEIVFFRSDTYNESEISEINETRKNFIDQRLALINQRNIQIEKIRGDSKTTSTNEDVKLAKQALDLAKSTLDSDTNRELEQIKLYNDRLIILDKEIQRWLDEGRGNVFRKGGLDKARETKIAQKIERDDIDSKIKKSQDKIDILRAVYSEQVKEYNNRVSTIELRTNSQRNDVDINIKNLERENGVTMEAITKYNTEVDMKISTLNTHKGELVEKSKTMISNNQEDVQKLHVINDELRQSIIHTDVGTFKFIAKSMNIPLDKAVNYFIWLIMIVFDPLAVCLIIAFNVIVSSDKKKELDSSVKVEPKPIDPPIEVISPIPMKISEPILTEELVVKVPEVIEEPKIFAPKIVPQQNHTLRDSEVYHAPTR